MKKEVGDEEMYHDLKKKLYCYSLAKATLNDIILFPKLQLFAIISGKDIIIRNQLKNTFDAINSQVPPCGG